MLATELAASAPHLQGLPDYLSNDIGLCSRSAALQVRGSTSEQCGQRVYL